MAPSYPDRGGGREGILSRSLLARLVAGALILTAAFAPPARAAASGLHVIPFPGTPDAAASSQIIFSSLRPAELRAVTVTGSRSGPHIGHLIRLPSGAGTAFAPDRPFIPGEVVRVTAALASPTAGTASGDPGARRLRFSFGVAVSAAAVAGAAQDSTPGSGPYMHFRSQVNFHPPLVHVSSDPDASSGDMFLTPHNGVQNGPMILDSTGHLIWFDPLASVGAFNLERQHLGGKPVLTWWQGTLINGHGTAGQDMILNSSYQPIADLHAGNGYSSDLHEFQITPQGTALIDAYVPVKTSQSRTGSVLDCVIQELNIKTGQVLWEWHAWGHIPLNASYESAPGGSTPYDYFHLNSIQRTSDGNLVISARDTWAIYKIDRSTGKLIWTLGGKHSSFKMGAGQTSSGSTTPGCAPTGS